MDGRWVEQYVVTSVDGRRLEAPATRLGVQFVVKGRATTMQDATVKG